MPRVPTPANKYALEKAEEEFQKKHPELKGRPLTLNERDAALRAEWLELYRKNGGKVLERVSPDRGKTTALTSCKNLPDTLRKVYVYMPQREDDDWHGHVGLVLEQKDGSYIRYSQQATNPNLHGVRRIQYLIWWQQAVVRKRPFPKGTQPRRFGKRGSEVVRIPTRFPDQVQSAVDEYIAEKSHYHVITNNCADFVNDCLNEAKDISLWDRTLPIWYFQQVKNKYPDCVIE